MSHVHHDIKAWLADHPRMMALAFTTVVLLSQAATVVAKEDTSFAGP